MEVVPLVRAKSKRRSVGKTTGGRTVRELPPDCRISTWSEPVLAKPISVRKFAQDIVDSLQRLMESSASTQDRQRAKERMAMEVCMGVLRFRKPGNPETLDDKVPGTG
jgi:hypothetical protein